jgi:hypothetical protein
MRFPRAPSDLRIDTSPELLGQAVGGFSQNHYPYALYRALGPSLTANMQGAKRPLGASTQGNQQAMVPQQKAFDVYKVSAAPQKLSPDTCCSATLIIPLMVLIFTIYPLTCVEAQFRSS